VKILSMTATFGKLDRETLTLEPGLQIIEAPNEWGKSTWCAFMVAMFYGISTSSRKKTDFLPDKERYAPWCGKPMTGRMELLWKGKAITIERSPKGKIPFGNFRAYETDSGIPVPELTADNCGITLLGVEREVFTRAGFLRGTDLPVGEDEALRRRLNALVTTGDESGAGDDLAQKLKDLKNECRHNKTGRIPQAEQQAQALQDKLSRLDQLKGQCAALRQQEQAQAEYAEQLKNHKVALAYEKSLQTQNHVDKARADLEQVRETERTLQAQCKELPTKQTAEEELQRLQQLQQQWALQQEQEASLPEMPQKPEAPAPFAGKDPQTAMQQAKSDSSAYKILCKPISPVFLILAVIFLLGAVGMLFVNWIISLPCLVLAAGCVGVHLRNKNAQGRDRQEIVKRYAKEDPDSWVALAQDYADRMEAYQQALLSYQSEKTAVLSRRSALQETAQLLTSGRRIGECLEFFRQVLAKRQALEDAQRAVRQAEEYVKTVSSLVQTAPAPEQPDPLTLSEAQTEQALQQLDWEQRQLHQRLGQYEGQMEALGDRGAIEQELTQVQERLGKLENYNAALTMALETLNQATTELQRRFAPRISARARELFGKLTGGRYDRLLLSSDFSMEVAATDEDIPHGVLWRSDGTADGLYLALRLAVAEELTPEAPLVLDDAFVRFDDKRLKAAMEILKEYAEEKQVILFTCQTREKEWQHEQS